MSSEKFGMRLFFKDPDLPMLLTMFLPIFADMLLNNFIGTVHAYFVADAGEAVISAISLANQLNNLISAVFFSACSATMVVVAQIRGTGDNKRAALVTSQTLCFTIYGTAIIAVLFNMFPSQIMTLFFAETDPIILVEAVKYIPLLGISIPFYAVFYICACASRGFDNHKIPLFISVSGSVLNVIFAFILIKVLGLGIIGAGISLILSRMFSAGAGIVLFIKKKWLAPFRDSVRVRFSVIKNVLYLGFFTSSESIITNFAGTLKTGFLVPFGISHITASSVYGSFSGLLSVPITVIGTMVTTLIAKSISAGDGKRARELLTKCIVYCFTISSLIFVAAYFILPHIFPSYTDNPDTLKLLDYLLIINCIGTPTLSLFVTLISNAFNGAGDAKFSTIVSVACMIVLNLGGGYLFTVVFGWGVIGSHLSAYLSLIAKMIIYIWRYKSGKWVKKVMV